MGLSFEEMLGGVGRWLDRTWTDVSWWWRSRGLGGSLGSGGGTVRDAIDRGADWVREQVGRLRWWLQTRGVSTGRFSGGGSISMKSAARWVAAVVVLCVLLLVARHAAKPEPPAPISESEIALLQSMRVPLPKERRVEAPTAKPESGLKLWLMRALGLQ